jgi:hypothetical protein
MPDGQIIVVEYNGRHNAFSGVRNVHRILNIESKLDIAPMIEAQLKGLSKGGYVLVSFAQSLFICELDNVDPTKPYRKHKINYHPFSSEFDKV